MTTTHVSERFPEIDVARGIAVVMMVFFHIAFDLYFLAILPIPADSLPWRVFAMTTAGLFLFLVGISLSISAGNARNKLSRNDFIKKYLARGQGSLQSEWRSPLSPGSSCPAISFCSAFCTLSGLPSH